MTHNYEALGFKAGLEIHQQLPRRKLFSHCPTTIRKDDPDFHIHRQLRSTTGEMGGVDAAAKHESQKQKTFTYQGYNDTDSLVEIDEEPPHTVCEEAVTTAVMVAGLLDMDLVDKVQFMRKTVIDGSNVSGFQRTALIATDGAIEIDGETIRIDSLCLEEEACQVRERTETHDTYNLSRLGIPLLEIATAPDITDPEQCKKAAAKIGMYLRSTERVKRGLGTIRQDVNVSIAEGARTEVKGFQDYRNIPVVVENEVERQVRIVEKGKTVTQGVRKAEEDGTTTYLRPMPGADRMYPETDVETFRPDAYTVELPRTIPEREAAIQEPYDLSQDIARNAVRAELNTSFSFKEVFEEYANENLTPTNIVELFTVKKELVSSEVFQDVIEDVLEALSNGDVSYNSVDDILEDAENGTLNLANYALMSDDELRDIIRGIVEENPDAPRGALMGMIMRETQGQADGSKASQILNDLL